MAGMGAKRARLDGSLVIDNRCHLGPMVEDART